MRYVILDTETTGLSPREGHRMVEIGAIAMRDRAVLPERLHYYINPGREIPEEVVRIHGIDDAKVADAPRFAEIADELLAFIDGATLIIHNAPFDLDFLMHELGELGREIDEVPVIDTLEIARRRFPNQKVSLDVLCDRFGVDRTRRTLHGALLDSELLAEVYLAMTGGRQFSLQIDDMARPARSFVRRRGASRRSQLQERRETELVRRRNAPRLAIADEERQAHLRLLERIWRESGGALIWRDEALELDEAEAAA